MNILEILAVSNCHIIVSHHMYQVTHSSSTTVGEHLNGRQSIHKLGQVLRGETQAFFRMTWYNSFSNM